MRYKQTVLGAAWAIIQPLTTMVIFTIIFGKLAKIPSDGLPYPVFSFCALLPWNYFAGSMDRAGNSLVGSANLITKVYFPRLVVPLAATMAGARIGRNCVLGQNVVVASDVIIGNNVKIQNNVSVYSGVTLEDDVFCGPSAVFTNVVNPRSHVSRKHEFKPTFVRRGATVGANATVVCGHEIGAYAFVGVGSVVARDVPPYALVMGVPARLVGWMCQCGEKLTFESQQAVCARCGTRYRQAGSERLVREGES